MLAISPRLSVMGARCQASVCVAVCAVVLALVPSRSALAGNLHVPASANIFGAGHSTSPAPAGGGAGSMPPSISLSGVGSVTFNVSGQVSYNGANYYGPDGGQYLVARTALDSYGGISGIQHDSRT